MRLYKPGGKAQLLTSVSVAFSISDIFYGGILSVQKYKLSSGATVGIFSESTCATSNVIPIVGTLGCRMITVMDFNAMSIAEQASIALNGNFLGDRKDGNIAVQLRRLDNFYDMKALPIRSAWYLI